MFLLRYLALPLFLLALDQALKFHVRNFVPLLESTPLIPNFLEFTYLQNKGISFSFMSNLPESFRALALISVSCIAIVFVLFYWFQHHRTLRGWPLFGLCLLLSGAFSNLYDRFADGFVTDYFLFRFYELHFFVNNIADICITGGILIYFLSSRKTPA